MGVVLGSLNPTNFSVACSDDVATFVRTRSKVEIEEEERKKREIKEKKREVGTTVECSRCDANDAVRF